MAQTYRRTVQFLAGISAILLLGVMLLYTSYDNPVVLGRYSIRYLLLTVIVVAVYLFLISLLLKVPGISLWKRIMYLNYSAIRIWLRRTVCL